MNIALSKEIYGLNTWCMDEVSFPAYMSVLNNIKNGVKLEIPETKYNSISFLDVSSEETRLIKDKWDLKNGDTFSGIGIISLNGVITVNGGMSTHGMTYLSETMQIMAKDERVKSFIILGDSGGGSSMAVEIMSETIKEIDKIKPVYGLVKKGGMMASACFGIMSACRGLWAESEMSIVGSAGTMMQFEGRKANDGAEDMHKYKQIRIYAPESTHKNEGFEKAIQSDDYSILIDNMLKPMNQRFLALIEANRPKLKGTSFRNGHTKFAKDSIGTFIDGIKSFSEVIDIASKGVSQKEEDLNDIKTENNNSNTNINNKNKMKKADFKAANPTAYNEILAEGKAMGQSTEKDRVGAWMAHNETDPVAVKAGIASGKEITATEREEIYATKNAAKKVEEIKSDSAEEVITPESSGAEKIKKTEAQAKVDKAFDFDL